MARFLIVQDRALRISSIESFSTGSLSVDYAGNDKIHVVYFSMRSGDEYRMETDRVFSHAEVAEALEYAYTANTSHVGFLDAVGHVVKWAEREAGENKPLDEKPEHL